MTAKTAIAMVAVVASLASVSAHPARDDEPPPVRTNHCAWDVWPEADLANIEVGRYYEWQVRGTFGARFARPAAWDSRCIAFAYDEDLVVNSPLFLVVRVDAGKVQGKWLAKAPFLQTECAGRPQEVVALKGYYHAGACW